MKMGEKIIALRTYLGMKPSEFARVLGVHQALIYKWERGFTVPDTQSIKKFLQKFSYLIDANYFFESKVGFLENQIQKGKINEIKA